MFPCYHAALHTLTLPFSGSFLKSLILEKLQWNLSSISSYLCFPSLRHSFLTPGTQYLLIPEMPRTYYLVCLFCFFSSSFLFQAASNMGIKNCWNWETNGNEPGGLDIRNNLLHKYTCSLMSTTELFTVAKCPTTNEWINKAAYPSNGILLSHKN